MKERNYDDLERLCCDGKKKHESCAYGYYDVRKDDKGRYLLPLCGITQSYVVDLGCYYCKGYVNWEDIKNGK